MYPKKLRILHCNFLNEKRVGIYYYSNNRRISNGLIRNGHFVYEFSFRELARMESLSNIKKLGSKRMNRKLLETAENIQPHVLLLGHAELIRNDTLHEFRRRFPDTKIAMWWVDWLDDFLVNRDASLFAERMALLDCLFTTTDAAFVREKYQPAKDVPEVFFMPNSCDPSMDIGRAFECEAFQHDVVFVSRSTPKRGDVMQFLKSNMADLNLGLYGQNRRNMMLGHRYIDMLSATRIGINFSRDIDIPLYTSNRMIQLAGNGCLVVTPRTPKMETLFGEDEVVYFDGLNDMEEKIRHHIAHPDETRRIAEAGHRKAHSTFTCDRVMAKMVDQIIGTDTA